MDYIYTNINFYYAIYIHVQILAKKLKNVIVRRQTAEVG